MTITTSDVDLGKHGVPLVGQDTKGNILLTKS